MQNIKLSIVLPFHNEEAGIESFLKRLWSVLEQFEFSFEVIAVDDGSKDKTLACLVEQKKQYPQLKIVELSRNFGKESALFGGLSQASGSLICTLDSDGQHPPELIPQMIQLLNDIEIDLVNAVKIDRGRESVGRRFFVKSFYKLMSKMADLNLDSHSDFKVYRREVLDVLLQYQESRLFYRGLVHFSGFHEKQVLFKVEERPTGQTSFSSFRLFKMALQIVIGFSSKPLFLVPILGGFFILVGILIGLRVLSGYLVHRALDGIPTLAFTMLISTGTILVCLSMIAVYLARVYEETKKRPRFIIRKTY